MKTQPLGRAVLVTFLGVMSCVAITACNHVADNAKREHTSAKTPASSTAQSIILYSGQTSPGAKVVIESPDAKQELVGDRANIPKGSDASAPNAVVSAAKGDKYNSGDALHFSWKDSWRAALNFEATSPVDLTPYMANGAVVFDMSVLELAKGGLAFRFHCGDNCDRKLPFLLPARELIGKGWQHMVVPLKCFALEKDNFSAVNLRFTLDAGGEGSVAIANVSVEKTAQGNTACLDYSTVAVTPSMLNEWWSIDWWQARHEQKLAELNALQAEKKHAEVIFIGDSITHFWERDGFNVWNRNYKKYNAIDLGFAGDRTENILWRLQHNEVNGLNPKVAVLMFGTNNTGQRLDDPQTTATAIKRNIDELQQRLPNTKILLLAIFPRDEKPDGQMRQINNTVNSIIANYADNKKIFFLDINKSFLDENGVLSKNIMPDLLHPNEQGYEIWARAMQPTLNSLLKK